MSRYEDDWADDAGFEPMRSRYMLPDRSSEAAMHRRAVRVRRRAKRIEQIKAERGIVR